MFRGSVRLSTLKQLRRHAAVSTPAAVRQRPVFFAFLVVAALIDGGSRGGSVGASGLQQSGTWLTGEWGSCVGNGNIFDADGNPVPPLCTGGWQSRDVACDSLTLQPDAPRLHDCTAFRPAGTRFCVVGERCGWIISGWGGCDAAECGDRGVETRTVQCTDPLGQWPGSCADLSAEESVTTRECIGSAGCDWWRSDWAACSRACGSGQQERLVQCTSLSGCSPEKPGSYRTCEGTDCMWVTREWSLCSGSCGTEGMRTREVHCESAGRCTGAAPPSQQSCPGNDGCARAVQSVPTPTPPVLGTGPVPPPPPDISQVQGGFNDASENDYDYYDLVEYFTGYWSSCSAECGAGQRSREVRCHKMCTVYRCKSMPEYQCQLLELEKPADEEPCQGRAGQYAGSGSGGSCLAGVRTQIVGTIHLRSSDAGTFVSSSYARMQLEKAVFELAGGDGTSGLSQSMITVSLQIVANEESPGGRRLNQEGAVAASYSIALGQSVSESQELQMLATLRAQALPEVQVQVAAQLALATQLQTFYVQVDGMTLEGDPTAAPTPAPLVTAPPTTPSPPQIVYECVSAAGAGSNCVQGSASLVGCFSSCVCCVQKNAVISQTPAPLAQQADPLSAVPVIPADSSEAAVDPADAATGDDSIAIPLVAALLASGFLIGVSGALLAWFFMPRRKESEGKSSKAGRSKSKGEKQEAWQGDTVNDEEQALYKCDTCGESTTDPLYCDSCGLKRPVTDNFSATWSAGFNRPDGVDADPPLRKDDGSKAARDPQSPSTSRNRDKGAAGDDGGRDPRRSKSESGSRSKSRRGESEGDPASPASPADWYDDMAKDFHGRKADAKAKGSGDRKSKRASTESKKSSEGGAGGSTKPPTPPRGTATPPRSTEKPDDSGFRMPGSPSNDEGSPSNDEGNEANGNEANTEDVGVVDELIAKLQKELDQTMGKDLESRRRIFKGLLLKWHPDKNQHQAVEATEVFKYLMKRRAGYMMD